MKRLFNVLTVHRVFYYNISAVHAQAKDVQNESIHLSFCFVPPSDCAIIKKYWYTFTLCEGVQHI